MSTVLWANTLLNGAVTSDQSDKFALYKHNDKLDEICLRTSQHSFQKLCDSTDLQFNLGDAELPDGIQSTDELMAINGVWASADEVVKILHAALADIQAKKTRFGLLRNDHDDVVAELEESIAYAQSAVSNGAKFNFSIVM